MLDNLQIIHKNVKVISLKVKPDLCIVLTVPFNTIAAEIERVLVKRNIWIKTQLDYFSKFQKKQQELVSGEDFYYLGKRYRLKVTESNENSIKLTAGFLHVCVTDKNNYQLKSDLINEWYKQKLLQRIAKYLQKYKFLFNVDVIQIKTRRMKTRWGSCNVKNQYINFNIELIKKSSAIIEYVVLHELTHLKHHNHDKRFYSFLTTHMPDWQLRKALLEKPDN